MTQLIDPIPQLRTWTPKIFSPARQVRHDPLGRDPRSLASAGGPLGLSSHARLWRLQFNDVISELRMAGYQGCIDIEGWHDPVYRGPR